MRPTKQQLLEHCSKRDPKLFIQFDGFDEHPDSCTDPEASSGMFRDGTHIAENGSKNQSFEWDKHAHSLRLGRSRPPTFWRSPYDAASMTELYPVYKELPPFFWQTEEEYLSHKAPAPKPLPGVPVG